MRVIKKGETILIWGVLITLSIIVLALLLDNPEQGQAFLDYFSIDESVIGSNLIILVIITASVIEHLLIRSRVDMTKFEKITIVTSKKIVAKIAYILAMAVALYFVYSYIDGNFDMIVPVILLSILYTWLRKNTYISEDQILAGIWLVPYNDESYFYSFDGMKVELVTDDQTYKFSVDTSDSAAELIRMFDYEADTITLGNDRNIEIITKDNKYNHVEYIFSREFDGWQQAVGEFVAKYEKNNKKINVNISEEELDILVKNYRGKKLKESTQI